MGEGPLWLRQTISFWPHQRGKLRDKHSAVCLKREKGKKRGRAVLHGFYNRGEKISRMGKGVAIHHFARGEREKKKKKKKKRKGENLWRSIRSAVNPLRSLDYRRTRFRVLKINTPHCEKKEKRRKMAPLILKATNAPSSGPENRGKGKREEGDTLAGGKQFKTGKTKSHSLLWNLNRKKGGKKKKGRFFIINTTYIFDSIFFITVSKSHNHQ